MIIPRRQNGRGIVYWGRGRLKKFLESRFQAGPKEFNMDISEFSRLSNKGVYKRHPWETSRKNVLHTFLKQSGIKFPINRIVDIGSGDAYVIHTLVKENKAGQYFAIDTAYTPEVVAQLKKNNNDSAVIYLQNLQEYIDKFQTQEPTLFLCMDVLEHLENEGVILDDLHPSGNNFYFFAVPAFQSIFSSHDVLLGHYRRYTLQELESLLKRYNFSILDKGYYFTSLLIFRKLDKWLRKNKEASIDNWEGGRVKTSVINKMLSTDFFFTSFLNKLGIRIPGLSCYCLCKK